MKYEKVPAVGLCIYLYITVKHLILLGFSEFLNFQNSSRGQIGGKLQK